MDFHAQELYSACRSIVLGNLWEIVPPCVPDDGIMSSVGVSLGVRHGTIIRARAKSSHSGGPGSLLDQFPCAYLCLDGDLAK